MKSFPETFQPQIPGLMPLFNVFNIFRTNAMREIFRTEGLERLSFSFSWSNGDIVFKKGLLFGCARYNHTAIH